MAKVLIIDNDPLLCDTLKMAAEGAGHTVVLAQNGREGLEIFETLKPDVVVTDILMPEKEGMETIVEVRRLNPGVPIIAMSGAAPTGNISFLKIAQKLGANRTLSKPFAMDAFVAAIAAVVKA
jgi:DNA-binding response OmpR family regulator